MPGPRQVIESVAEIHPGRHRPRWFICLRNRTPNLDRWRLKPELRRQHPQPRQLPLSPAPGDQIALHFMHYNFCGVHKTLRVTP